MTVVGVAGDVLNRRLTEPPQPILYRSLEQSSDLSLALLIRTRGATRDLAESVAREIRAVDPDLPVYSVRTMTDVIERVVAQRQFLMRLLVAFGAIATALALLGIYGVMAYSVSQRTREIGIRMAIGARQVDVSRMVMRRGMTLTAAGIVAGIAASLGLSQLRAVAALRRPAVRSGDDGVGARADDGGRGGSRLSAGAARRASGSGRGVALAVDGRAGRRLRARAVSAGRPVAESAFLSAQTPPWRIHVRASLPPRSSCSRRCNLR